MKKNDFKQQQDFHKILFFELFAIFKINVLNTIELLHTADIFLVVLTVQPRVNFIKLFLAVNALA